MSLFKRWFDIRRPRIHPDAFTLTVSRKYRTMCQWVVDLTRRGHRVIVLCHFQSTFLEIQTVLDEAGLEHEVLATRVSEEHLLRQLRASPPELMLTMAPMLESAGPVVSDPRNSGPPLAIIVTERHPWPIHDRRLEQFSRNLNTDVALGYLLSFEDPVIRHFLGKNFIELMQQLGLRDHDLISSAMTHKALRRALRRATANVTDEIAAESPSRWLELNMAGPDSSPASTANSRRGHS